MISKKEKTSANKKNNLGIKHIMTQLTIGDKGKSWAFYSAFSCLR